MKSQIFAISGMPIASTQYWNAIHGRGTGRSFLQDEEGLAKQCVILARNMASC